MKFNALSVDFECAILLAQRYSVQPSLKPFCRHRVYWIKGNRPGEGPVGFPMIERLSDNGGMRYRFTPNRSISWPALVRVWLGLVLLTSIVVVGMSLAGAWLVIPFAGLELVAVGAGLWYTARQCSRQEVITFGPSRVRLEKGHEHREQQWDWARPSVRILLEEKRHPWLRERVCVCCNGEEVPLADFLNPRDSRALVTLLESQGFPVRRRSREMASTHF